MNENQFNHPTIKLVCNGAAWCLSQVVSNAQPALTFVSTLLATLVSLCILTDFLWKRFGKAFAIRRGWKKGPPRDFMDSTDRMPLDRS